MSGGNEADLLCERHALPIARAEFGFRPMAKSVSGKVESHARLPCRLQPIRRRRELRRARIARELACGFIRQNGC